MANKNKIGASIVLEGEKEFKAAVTACNKQLSSMKSELSLVKEKYAENANSLEALQAKHKVLSQVLPICFYLVTNFVFCNLHSTNYQ